ANLRQAAGDAKGAGAEAARRLADALEQLANGDQAQRAAVEAAFTMPLKAGLTDLPDGPHAPQVTPANLPGPPKPHSVGGDGISRVEIAPKGDVNDDATLRRFARAVLTVAPNATGQGIATPEWGDTIVWSFEVAAGVALVSIALILWIVLRRFGDVLLT